MEKFLAWLSALFTPKSLVTGPDSTSGYIPVTPQTKVEVMMSVAEEELGQGETTGNNEGPSIERYKDWLNYGSQGAWCMAFAYYCLEEACRRTNERPPFKRTHSVNTAYDRILKAGGWQVSNPKPGDFAFVKSKIPGRYKHVMLVKTSQVGGKVLVIDGNGGDYPSVVSVRKKVASDLVYLRLA